MLSTCNKKNQIVISLILNLLMEIVIQLLNNSVHGKMKLGFKE